MHSIPLAEDDVQADPREPHLGAGADSHDLQSMEGVRGLAGHQNPLDHRADRGRVATAGDVQYHREPVGVLVPQRLFGRRTSGLEACRAPEHAAWHAQERWARRALGEALDDLGAHAIAEQLGNLPVVENASVPSGAVRVVLSHDYAGPGSGLEGGHHTTTQSASDTSDSGTTTQVPPSPIITAGTTDPKCVD